MDYLRSYEFLRDKFIELAEQEHLPISPTLGRSKQAAIGGGVYFEWYYDRLFQVAVSGPDAIAALDHALGTFPYKTEELPVLNIFVKDVEKDWPVLWKMRRAWFNFDLPPDEAEDEVKNLLNSY